MGVGGVDGEREASCGEEPCAFMLRWMGASPMCDVKGSVRLKDHLRGGDDQAGVKARNAPDGGSVRDWWWRW